MTMWSSPSDSSGHGGYAWGNWRGSGSSDGNWRGGRCKSDRSAGSSYYRSLGHLVITEHPAVAYLECHVCAQIHKMLSWEWWLIQGSVTRLTDMAWRKIMELLDLDERARQNLWLLCHSGTIERAYANKLM